MKPIIRLILFYFLKNYFVLLGFFEYTVDAALCPPPTAPQRGAHFGQAPRNLNKILKITTCLWV